jgi:hypothetical protein
LILAGIRSNLCQSIPCQFAKFFKFLWPMLRDFNHFLPCRCKVSFISVLSTAAVSRYPGGCGLSAHWREAITANVRCHDITSFVAAQYLTLKQFLGAFEKLRKITISFVMSVHLPACLSVCPSFLPHGTTRLPLDGFALNLIFDYFWKICRENSRLINSDKNNGYFTWKLKKKMQHVQSTTVLLKM